MNELSKRRNQLIAYVQRSERRKYMSRIREQLITKWKDQEQKTGAEAILYAAFVACEQQNGPYLDIYANIQQLIDEVLHNNNHTYFAYQLSLFLYITLTSSDEVIMYLVQSNAIKQWQKLRMIIRYNSKCQECIYERMRVFLEVICSKYGIQPFHTHQFSQNELKSIFSQEFTSQLIQSPLDLEEDSEHFGFVETYISLMPPSHLLQLFISGFAYQTIFYNINNLSLTLLGRFQAIRFISSEMDEIYQQYHQRIHEKTEADEINN